MRCSSSVSLSLKSEYLCICVVLHQYPYPWSQNIYVYALFISIPIPEARISMYMRCSSVSLSLKPENIYVYALFIISISWYTSLRILNECANIMDVYPRDAAKTSVRTQFLLIDLKTMSYIREYFQQSSLKTSILSIIVAAKSHI